MGTNSRTNTSNMGTRKKIIQKTGELKLCVPNTRTEINSNLAVIDKSFYLKYIMKF
jgi:hypothetical protein